MNSIHVLYSSNWSPGIIGLIAGKVTEEFYRPSITISVGKEISKGSARSIDGVNIVELIRKHSDILIDVGGHPGAAGFSILTSQIEVFKKRLEKEEIIIPQEKILEIDAEIPSNKLSKSLVKELSKFEPFGFGNPKPVLVSKGMKISDIRTVGNGKHLKFKVVDPELAEGPLDAIAFSMGELATTLQNGQLIDIAFNLEIDNYNNSEKLQLKVKDLKV